NVIGVTTNMKVLPLVIPIVDVITQSANVTADLVYVYAEHYGGKYY
ncbi:11472_t:CDS:1, partial [Scutellospora calospora]